MRREPDKRNEGPQPEAVVPNTKASKWVLHLPEFFLYIFTILLFVALIAHGYVGLFTRYMADDYCTASAVQTTGLLSTQKSFYLGWSGRYSFTFAISLLALIGHRIVPFLPAIALALLLVALTWTISKFGSIFSWRRPILTSFLLAEVIIFVTVSDNPGGVYEALYWQTGMVTYWFSLVLMVAYFGFVKNVDGSTSRIRVSVLYLFAGAALTFFAGGLNETYAVFQMCALLVAIGFILWAKRFRLLPILVVSFIGSVTAFTIVYMAPGNSVRLAHFSPPPDWLTLLKLSGKNTLNFMFSEQNYPDTYFYRAVALLIPALLAVYVVPRQDTSSRELFKGRKMQWLTLLVLPVVCFALILSCFVPAIYAMSKLPPPRALVIPQFLLISSLAAWSYFAGHLVRDNFLKGSPIKFPLVAALSAALAGLLGVAPVHAAWRTFSKVPRVRGLAEIWDRQDQEMHAARARGETELTVPMAYNIGGTDAMSGNPQWYVNQCVAAYYGVKRVTAKPSLEGLRILTDVPEE